MTQATTSQGRFLDVLERHGPARVKVIGVGDAGCRAVSELRCGGDGLVEVVCIDTDSASLDRSRSDGSLLLGAASLRGFGSGGDSAAVEVAAREQASAIRHLLSGAEFVVVVAGSAGGTGAGAAAVVAEVARSMGALTVSIALMPFEFEPIATHLRAADTLEQMRQASDAVIEAPKIGLITHGHAAAKLSDALQRDRQFAADVIGEISACFSDKNALRGVGASQLRAVLRCGASAVFGKGECAMDAVTAAESCLDSIEAPGCIERAVVLIESATDLPVCELARITSTIEQRCGTSVELHTGFKRSHSRTFGIRVSLIGALRKSLRPRILADQLLTPHIAAKRRTRTSLLVGSMN